MKFVQSRYVSSVSYRSSVFYELNLTNDGARSQILSLGLHFPSADMESYERASQIINTIKI